MSGRKTPGASAGATHGYWTSALVFAGITALWAVIVRDDPYYRLTDLFGVRIPAMLIAYLLLMPLCGVIVGAWRYQSPHRDGVLGLAAKLAARAVQFTYVHLLIVLFTVAMATDYFLGLNIDEQVKTIDDRMFDLAARFAPWVAAYLTGFNIGRALRGGGASALAQAETSAHFGANENTPMLEAEEFQSPAMANDAAGPANDFAEFYPRPGAPGAMTASGLPAWCEAYNNGEPGFLPPQDLDAIRPGLRQLR